MRRLRRAGSIFTIIPLRWPIFHEIDDRRLAAIQDNASPLLPLLHAPNKIFRRLANHDVNFSGIDFPVLLFLCLSRWLLMEIEFPL